MEVQPRWKKWWPVIIAGSVAAVILLACLVSFGIIALVRSSSRDIKIGEEVNYGDLTVTVSRVKVEGFTSLTDSGRQLVHQPSLVVHLTLKNKNPNRIRHAGSQAGRCSLKDDVGNTYKWINAYNELGLDSHISGQIEGGMERPIRSDEVGRDVLVFDRPVPGASKLWLTLDAAAYGGHGYLRLVITKATWQ